MSKLLLLQFSGGGQIKTVARKSSIGGVYVCAGGLYIQIWQKFH